MLHRILLLSTLFGTALILLPPVAVAGDTAAREQAARAVTRAFLQRLGSALQQQMGSNGPESAIRACRDVAPQIAGERSRANGWQVTLGTRAGIPMPGMPDTWQRKVLDDFTARASAGEHYPGMGYGAVVDAGGQQYNRSMQAIPVQGLAWSATAARHRSLEVSARNSPRPVRTTAPPVTAQANCAAHSAPPGRWI